MKTFNDYLEMVSGPLAGPQRGSQSKSSYDKILDQISDIENIGQSIGGAVSIYVNQIFGDDDPYADEEMDPPTTWDDYFDGEKSAAENTLDEMKNILKKQSPKEYKKLAEQYKW